MPSVASSISSGAAEHLRRPAVNAGMVAESAADDGEQRDWACAAKILVVSSGPLTVQGGPVRQRAAIIQLPR